MTKRTVSISGWIKVLSLLLYPCLPSLAQPVTTPMQAGRTADGIIYFLPKTAIELSLQVEKKTYTPGEFAKYGEKYLRLGGIEQEEQVTYSIAGFGLTQIGIRDTSKCYAVKLKGGKCETAEIHLTDDGVLQAINADPILPKARTPFKPAKRPEPVNPRNYLSAEVLSANSTAKMAELTVRQLLELQERRQQLITGDADDMPKDEKQLQTMIEEIDKQRGILMSMFTGTTRRDTTEQTLVICPDKEVQKEVIFRLSKKLGVVDKDDLSGIPYYMTVEDQHRTTLQKYDIPENKKEGGFYLNVPGRIKLSLYRESHFLAAFDLYAAQFGFVELRSGSLFKRYVTHMQLNPTTGSVEKIHADIK